MSTSTHEEVDIHDLIQNPKGDFYTFIQQHLKSIDDHVETCPDCRERMIGKSSLLPKLRARVTVQLPEAKNEYERMQQMAQLQRGQCLPCGCEVIDVAWTPRHACLRFYRTLAKIMEVPDDVARRISITVDPRDLPLDTKSLRRLRDAFWIPDGSYGSPELRDAEEGDTVLQLPETIEDFINEILRLHSGTVYMNCSDHWCP